MTEAAHDAAAYDDAARLVLGLTLASMAAAFFENKLSSPSNIAIFMTIVSSVILVRLRELARPAPVRMVRPGPPRLWVRGYRVKGYS